MLPLKACPNHLARPFALIVGTFLSSPFPVISLDLWDVQVSKRLSRRHLTEQNTWTTNTEPDIRMQERKAHVWREPLLTHTNFGAINIQLLRIGLLHAQGAPTSPKYTSFWAKVSAATMLASVLARAKRAQKRLPCRRFASPFPQPTPTSGSVPSWTWGCQSGDRPTSLASANESGKSSKVGARQLEGVHASPEGAKARQDRVEKASHAKKVRKSESSNTALAVTDEEPHLQLNRASLCLDAAHPGSTVGKRSDLWVMNG